MRLQGSSAGKSEITYYVVPIFFVGPGFGKKENKTKKGFEGYHVVLDLTG